MLKNIKSSTVPIWGLKCVPKRYWDTLGSSAAKKANKDATEEQRVASLNVSFAAANKAKTSAKQLRSNFFNTLACFYCYCCWQKQSDPHQEKEELQWSVANCGGPQ